jgi:hypothetical protein
VLKLGTVYWRDYAEHTADHWDQESERVEFASTRDEFWEDPHRHSAAVDYRTATCATRKNADREKTEKRKASKMLTIVPLPNVPVKENAPK